MKIKNPIIIAEKFSKLMDVITDNNPIEVGEIKIVENNNILFQSLILPITPILSQICLNILICNEKSENNQIIITCKHENDHTSQTQLSIKDLINY